MDRATVNSLKPAVVVILGTLDGTVCDLFKSSDPDNICNLPQEQRNLHQVICGSKILTP